MSPKVLTGEVEVEVGRDGEAASGEVETDGENAWVENEVSRYLKNDRDRVYYEDWVWYGERRNKCKRTLCF
jgi:hypothetical protein